MRPYSGPWWNEPSPLIGTRSWLRFWQQVWRTRTDTRTAFDRNTEPVDRSAST
ncbi:MAG TPA: hypothetical protein VFB32_17900 [Rudaea sp.]|nr:hypothetical protein [Rudaea sp.]